MPIVLIRRQEADHEGRATHDQQRDQEGILATDEVADAPEEQRAEGPRGEPGRERRQGGEDAPAFVARREELSGQDDAARLPKM